MPSCSDIRARREPYAGKCSRMLNKPTQRSNAASSPNDSRVQPNGHDAGAIGRLRVQHFERFPHVLKKVSSLNETGTIPEAEVIDVGTVRHDKMLFAIDHDKIRRVVVVCIRIVEKSAFLDD